VRFEWDAAKDRANHAGCGKEVDAMLRLSLLVVVHVYREAEDGEEIVRIISARKARKYESRPCFQ
jgi:uncharacterized DUF497 family protein